MRKNIPANPATQSRPGNGYSTSWPRPANDTNRELEAEKAHFRAKYQDQYKEPEYITD